jgi:hypothetical protein
MKKLIVILLPVFALVFMGSKNSVPATMTFTETKYNFGFIHQGDVVSHDFVFTNTGDDPIIITNCEVACHCTTVDYPRSPILKGQTGTIKVTFDSKDAIDKQNRTVIVTSNATNSPVTLEFKCVVLKAKK